MAGGTLHLLSLVSKRLIKTSNPPTSRIANWHVSWERLKSRIAHKAMTVAVWFPPYEQWPKGALQLMTKNDIVSYDEVNTRYVLRYDNFSQ